MTTDIPCVIAKKTIVITSDNDIFPENEKMLKTLQNEQTCSRQCLAEHVHFGPGNV